MAKRISTRFSEAVQDMLEVLKGITIDLTTIDDATFTETINKVLPPIKKSQVLDKLIKHGSNFIYGFHAFQREIQMDNA